MAVEVNETIFPSPSPWLSRVGKGAKWKRPWQRELKAVVCTSTLDLGIDWAMWTLSFMWGHRRLQPAAAAYGRSNHRLDSPAKRF